jgi:hypothetical protein
MMEAFLQVHSSSLEVITVHGVETDCLSDTSAGCMYTDTVLCMFIFCQCSPSSSLSVRSLLIKLNYCGLYGLPYKNRNDEGCI